MTPANVGLSIALPSSLGFLKREYGVSYGYGGSIALVGLLAYKASTNKLALLSAPSLRVALSSGVAGLLQWARALSTAQALSLMHIIYGVRLCLFLSYRELKIPRFREMREKIEEQAPRGGRLARAPFILQCGLLYLWMSCPLFVLATLPAEKFLSPLASVTAAATSASLQGFCSAIVPLLLSVAGLGLALQIVGDTHKLLAKRADPDRLVTSGLFRFLRHPNYTGEHVLWGASSLAGCLACVFYWIS